MIRAYLNETVTLGSIVIPKSVRIWTLMAGNFRISFYKPNLAIVFIDLPTSHFKFKPNHPDW
jgi:hypothetical protein